MSSFASFHSNTDPATKLEENTVKTENPVSDSGKEASFQEMGKAEFFYDSQPLIDSDCEDFFSVNGDSTPIHPKNSMKKQLIDLFSESFNSSAAVNGKDNLKGKSSNIGHPETSAVKSSGEVPIQNSTPGRETTRFRDYLPRKQKSNQSAPCCIPGLMQILSFGERKKRLNPSETG